MKIRLEACSPAHLLALLESPATFEAAFRKRVAIVVLREADLVIGSAGYKGPPDGDGMVEIAYGIATQFRGRGFAAQAASALIAWATQFAETRLMRAHTLPEQNASTRVLLKCGFSCAGEVIDPQEGRVWRWERHP